MEVISSLSLDHTRSAGDVKNYRVICLASALEVLLVSTKEKGELRGETNAKAAAAMSVQVGSFADPDVAEGCAHFLEHMVFMGSEKYPDENYYDSYVQSHGGSCNAFTEGEYTTYQFDINSQSFSHGLDIFAHCFISPLLSVSSMSREINAINSEFNIAKTNDGNRLQQLFCHECTTGHVLKKFSWGNEKSLKDMPVEKGVDLHGILKSFHATHYTPGNMKLVVVGPFSLDDLQRDVVASFGTWLDSNKGKASATTTTTTTEEVGAVSQELSHTKIETVTSSVAVASPGGTGGARKKKKIESTVTTTTTTSVAAATGGKKAHGKKQKMSGAAAGASDYSVLPTLDECLCMLQGVRPLTDTMLHTFTRLVPIRHTHKLLLQFQLPPTMVQYRTKPASYISHLLGHEGPNSLLSLLKTKHSYANSLSSGISSSNMEENSLFSLFEIHIVLTDKGFSNWPEVCSIVHQYIKMLRDATPQHWVHEEIRQLAEIYYRFLDEEEVSELAESLSIEMLPYLKRDRHDLLGASYLHYEWDPAAVQEILDKYMTVKSAKVSVQSPVYAASSAAAAASGEKDEEVDGSDDDDDDDDEEDDDESGSESGSDGSGEDDDGGSDSGSDDDDEDEDKDDEAADPPSKLSVEQITSMYSGPAQWLSLVLPPTTAPSVEPHFGTQYWHDRLPKDLIKHWEQAKVDPLLKLPPKNAFIPQNLAMVSAAPTASASSSAVEPPTITPSAAMMFDTQKEPVRLTEVNTDGVTVWHLLNERFQSPKVEMFCKLSSSVSPRTPLSATCHDLYSALLRDVLNETLYMASMADLNCEITMTEVAIVVKVSGYSDKSVLLMNTVVDACFGLASRVTEGAFEREVNQLKRRYSNSNMTSSHSASDVRLRVLLPFKCAIETKLEVLTTEGAMTIETFHAYAADFISHMCVEWFVEGNLLATNALDLVSNLGKCAPSGVLSEKNMPKQPVTRLEENTIFLLHGVPRNPLENNVCVEIYFQWGPHNLDHLTRLDLLEQLVSEPYFDDLRTKQQLGYSVSCGVRQTHGILGFCFQVLSSAFTLTQVQTSILTFVQNIGSHTLDTMPAEKYHTNVSALVSVLSEPDLSLSDSASRNWSEIDDYRYDFALKKKQVALLNAGETDETSALRQAAMVAFAKELFLKAPKMLIAHSSLDATETKEMTIESFTAGFQACVLKKGDSVDSVRDSLSTF